MSATRTPAAGSRDAVVPLPDLRQDVALVLRGRDSYSARVTRRTPDEILLVLMLESRDPLHPGDVVETTIEYAGGRGLVRLEGRGTVVTSDLMRFHLEGDVDVLQRRDFVRVQAVRPLQIAPLLEDGGTGAWIDTLTANVSGNGLLAAGPETLALGDKVCFRIVATEGEPPIEGRGHVTRHTDAGQRALAIDELDGDGRRRLIRFIFEQERITRQRTRDAEL
ncbi:MAG TPA: PilZ domain-containing protein [Conexibacter sp.]|nr:PilZ domain-containing protein [Conexibacter sp.]